ncbi:MAG: universal stress protein, partial [Acidimicrobiales bacterium]
AASAGRRVEDPGWRQAALDDVEARLAPLAAEGLNVLALVEEGDPARTLAQVGSREHADLLVLGRRGAGGFHGLHLGSVALRVLHETAVPVVLIPPTAA